MGNTSNTFVSISKKRKQLFPKTNILKKAIRIKKNVPASVKVGILMRGIEPIWCNMFMDSIRQSEQTQDHPYIANNCASN